MEKIFSWILTVIFVGLAFSLFISVASIVLPILFVIVGGSFLWMQFKRQQIRKTMLNRRPPSDCSPKGEIIDVEYEIIDDNRK